MVNLFYNQPTPPPGIFDAFLAIPAIAVDISTRSYLSLVLSANTNLTAGLRCAPTGCRGRSVTHLSKQGTLQHDITYFRHGIPYNCYA
jgi:hypothetical protein